MSIKEIIAVLLLLSIVVPFGMYFMNGKRHGKRIMLVNIFSFFAVAVVASVFIFSGNVSAAEEVAEIAANNSDGLKFMAAGLVTGLACIGAGIAVAAAASSALGAISENEKIMGKALIFVALAEGIALYGLLVSFTILGG